MMPLIIQRNQLEKFKQCCEDLNIPSSNVKIYYETFRSYNVKFNNPTDFQKYLYYKDNTTFTEYKDDDLKERDKKTIKQQQKQKMKLLIIIRESKHHGLSIVKVIQASTDEDDDGDTGDLLVLRDVLSSVDGADKIEFDKVKAYRHLSKMGWNRRHVCGWNKGDRTYHVMTSEI